MLTVREIHGGRQGQNNEARPWRSRPRELAEMTNRRTSHGPSSTSAIGATLGAIDRHEPSHSPWPFESTHQPCPPQLPAGIDREEEPGWQNRVTVGCPWPPPPTRRTATWKAATGSSRASISGGTTAAIVPTRTRSRTLTHRAPSHRLEGVSTASRRSIPDGVDRRAAQQLSRVTKFCATRCVARASYPHGTFQPFSGGC